MTASPNPLNDLAALAAEFDRPHPAVLRAGSAIVEWLRTLPRPTGGIDSNATAMLLGLRVEPDADLDTGAWEVLDQYGDELANGRVGEPGDHVVWANNTFYAFSSDAFKTGRSDR